MKNFLIVFACGLALVTGCKHKVSEDSVKRTSADESTEAATKTKEVEMLLPAQQHVGMVVAPVAVTRLTEFFRAVGTVQPIDSHVGEVAPLARGRVVEVKARVGDRVRAGQVLATFDNIDAIDLSAQEQSARAELARLNAQRIPIERQAERSHRLAAIGAGSEKDAESGKAEEQSIDANIQSQQALLHGLEQRLQRYGVAGGSIGLSALKAPFNGVVVKTQASPGDVIDAGHETFTVADLSRVWVQAEVYEKDLGRIHRGQNAAIKVDTYPDESFSGRVVYVSDVLDPQTRTARVRCEVDNQDHRLKTDMFVNVDVPTLSSKQGLAVPSSALQTVEGKTVVFVRHSPTKFEARLVQTGIAVNGQTEITSGLKVGEQVVTQGAFHLKSILAVGEMGDED
ncbi:MAG TPA: efflux RND transporter periplasmic adaptor subunit [Edaphobacter sp.]|nr:efflux RND transporter periplasmic adaptor subunit [Edaphobacter sp.]